MQALAEAVETNQVHNRDPVGGSNENLFLWVLFLFLFDDKYVVLFSY